LNGKKKPSVKEGISLNTRGEIYTLVRKGRRFGNNLRGSFNEHLSRGGGICRRKKEKKFKIQLWGEKEQNYPRKGEGALMLGGGEE